MGGADKLVVLGGHGWYYWGVRQSWYDWAGKVGIMGGAAKLILLGGQGWHYWGCGKVGIVGRARLV